MGVRIDLVYRGILPKDYQITPWADKLAEGIDGYFVEYRREGEDEVEATFITERLLDKVSAISRFLDAYKRMSQGMDFERLTIAEVVN